MSTTEISVENSPLFGNLSAKDLEALRPYIEEVSLRAGAEVVSEGEASDTLYVILAGQAQVFRGDLALSVIETGDCFGEMGLLTGTPRAGSVRALTPLTVAKLSKEGFERLAETHPHLTAKLFRNLSTHLRSLLTDMTDTVALLLQERARPLRTEVEVRMPGESKTVKAGTPVAHLLPKQADGAAVVAALLDRKAVSLNSPLYASASLEPLTLKSWEGREIYRHSVGLLLLEAAYELDPTIRLRIGPSLGFAHLVEVDDASGRERGELTRQIIDAMRQLVTKDAPFRRERWTVEEARAQFVEQGWHEAARLLRTWRDNTVPLVSCGDVYAFEVGPLVASTGHLTHFDLVSEEAETLLYFGDSARQAPSTVRASNPEQLAREHEDWLKALGATSVGAFNDICINGRISQVIRVSEGFHEKRIGQIADEIASSPHHIRIICISGPSSAGKTTFIKRLTVQLQVNGLMPLGLSLDDYYVDRELTPRDERGDYDFEAFAAIRLDLLADHLERLVAGEAVQTARFDFTTGKSHPDGGSVLQLGPNGVLLVEGIHGLNPRLPVDDESHGVFRVFVNPMTSLPLDHVTRVSVSDVRLLRRIVRDRHGRAITAADNIMRWPLVRRGERRHIFPHQGRADAVFNSSLIYEPSVLKVYAERYLLEVPESHPAYTTAYRLRRLVDQFVAIYPDHVPPTSLLREFIGGIGSGK